MRLIDADALKAEIATIMPSRIEVFLVVDKMQDAIVKCWDCKFFIGEGHHCKIRGMGRTLKPDDFCSDGRSVK